MNSLLLLVVFLTFYFSICFLQAAAPALELWDSYRFVPAGTAAHVCVRSLSQFPRPCYVRTDHVQKVRHRFFFYCDDTTGLPQLFRAYADDCSDASVSSSPEVSFQWGVPITSRVDGLNLYNYTSTSLVTPTWYVLGSSGGYVTHQAWRVPDAGDAKSRSHWCGLTGIGQEADRIDVHPFGHNVCLQGAHETENGGRAASYTCDTTAGRPGYNIWFNINCVGGSNSFLSAANATCFHQHARKPDSLWTCHTYAPQNYAVVLFGKLAGATSVLGLGIMFSFVLAIVSTFVLV